jgi:hypothetical protein
MKKRLSVLVATLCLAAGLAEAQNLLINGDFNDPNTADSPTAWNLWTYGGGWANHQNDAYSFDGSYYMADGGSSGAGGGEYQIVPATAGGTYTLTVESGAQAWWLPYGEMRVFFMDSNTNQLVEDFRSTVDPAVYGQNYDIAHPWTNYTLVATAPVNTAFVKVEFAEPNGTGTVWFDNAVLTVIPEPSTVALVIGSVAVLGGWVRRGHRRSHLS